MSAHPFDQLTPDFILDAIESEDYRSDGRILALNSYENRVYQIGIEDQLPLIAKFYRPERWTSAQIEEEHDFCLELAAAEWPVVPPMRNPDGSTLFQFRGFYFALFERRGGHAPELGNLNDLEVLGRSLGRLHSLGAQKSFAQRPVIDIQSYGIESREFLLHSDFIPLSLQSAYESLSRDLIDKMQSEFAAVDYRVIRIHGDCHPGNILWRDETPLYVDFDDCRCGPAIQDIWMLLNGDQQDQRAQLETILEGYELFHQLDLAELQLIESLRTLRLMNYAAWLARRWQDPAFPLAFPWFASERFWDEHILTLREQFAKLQEPALQLINGNS